jgi:hypothetical protein
MVTDSYDQVKALGAAARMCRAQAGRGEAHFFGPELEQLLCAAGIGQRADEVEGALGHVDLHSTSSSVHSAAAWQASAEEPGMAAWCNPSWPQYRAAKLKGRPSGCSAAARNGQPT